MNHQSIIGAVVNLRFTLLLDLLEAAGAVAVFVLSFTCVIMCFMRYVVYIGVTKVR